MPVLAPRQVPVPNQPLRRMRGNVDEDSESFRRLRSAIEDDDTYYAPPRPRRKAPRPPWRTSDGNEYPVTVRHIGDPPDPDTLPLIAADLPGVRA